MNPEGTACISDEVMVFDGNRDGHHTVEGAKLYKKDGTYYIFAPAGGVATGWQLVMKSDNIYGPYEARNVMDQGSSDINGPHQGAWVDTPSGEHWFIHFQEKQPFGRIVHLNPLEWKEDGWCVIGEDKDGDGVCRFSYSLDGKSFKDSGTVFQAREGRWIGARTGLFCSSQDTGKDRGWIDIDWFSIEE